MGSPGGVEVGRVKVRAVPDTSQFFSELRADLERAERSLKVEVKVTADTTRLREEIRAAAASVTGIEVNVRADTDRMREEIRAVAREVGSITVNVRGDVTQLREDIQRAGLGIKGPVVKIKLEIDQASVAAVRAQAVILQRYLIALFNSIPIRFDLNGFNAVFAQLLVLQLLLASLRDQTIRVDINRNSLLGVTRTLVKSFAGAAKDIGKLIAGAFAFGGIATAIAGLGASAFSALPAVASLAASLLSLGPAAATGITAIVGLVTVMKTLKIATAGVGDAFKAIVNGDAKALDKALKKLSPSAKEFVREFQRLQPALKATQQAVQQTFFTGLAEQLRKTAGNLLPTVRAGLLDLTKVANRAAIEILRVFQTQGAKAGTRGLLLNITQAFRPLANLAPRVAQALLQIAGSAGPALVGISNTVASFALDFITMINRLNAFGGLRDLIQGAVDSAGQLFRTVGQIGGVISGVFKALSAASGDAAGLFGSAVQSLNRLVNSAAGQKALIRFFKGLNDAGKAVNVALGNIVRQVLPALGDALTTIAPAAAKLFDALGPALTDVIDALAPIIATIGVGLAGAIAKLTPSIGPLGQALEKAFGPIADVLPAIAAAIADVVVAIAPLLPALGGIIAGGARFAGLLLQILTPALSVLATILEAVVVPATQVMSDVFKQISTSIGPQLKSFTEALARAFARLGPPLLQAATAFLDALLPVLPKITDAFEQALPVIIKIADAFTDSLIVAIAQIIPQLPTLAESFGEIAVAMASILISLAPLLPLMVRLITQVLSDPRTLQNMADGIKAVAQGMAACAQGAAILLPPILQLTAAFVTFTLAVTATVGSLIAGFTAAVVGVATAIAQIIAAVIALPVRIQAALGNLGTTLAGIAKRAWDGLTAQFRTGIGTASTTAGTLPGRVTSAVGNLAGRLVSAGRDFVMGFVRGIQGAIGDAVAAAASMAAAAASAVTGFLDSHSPSRLMRGVGFDTGKGFQLGILDALGIVASAGKSLAGAAVQPAMAGGLAAAGTPNIGLQVFFGNEQIDGRVRMVTEDVISAQARRLQTQGVRRV